MDVFVCVCMCVDAMEGGDVEMVDIPNAFIQTEVKADGDTKMIMKMHFQTMLNVTLMCLRQRISKNGVMQLIN